MSLCRYSTENLSFVPSSKHTFWKSGHGDIIGCPKILIPPYQLSRIDVTLIPGRSVTLMKCIAQFVVDDIGDLGNIGLICVGKCLWRRLARVDRYQALYIQYIQ